MFLLLDPFVADGERRNRFGFFSRAHFFPLQTQPLFGICPLLFGGCFVQSKFQVGTVVKPGTPVLSAAMWTRRLAGLGVHEREEVSDERRNRRVSPFVSCSYLTSGRSR